MTCELWGGGGGGGRVKRCSSLQENPFLKEFPQLKPLYPNIPAGIWLHPTSLPPLPLPLPLILPPSPSPSSFLPILPLKVETNMPVWLSQQAKLISRYFKKFRSVTTFAPFMETAQKSNTILFLKILRNKEQTCRKTGSFVIISALFFSSPYFMSKFVQLPYSLLLSCVINILYAILRGGRKDIISCKFDLLPPHPTP
jgi:hypothetical protein